MSHDLLVGLDVGTTSCKAVVARVDGAELARSSAPTPWRKVPTGAELDPGELLEAALGAIREALSAAPGGHVAALGVTSMAETGVLLDASGNPVVPAIAWHDGRGEQEAALLAAELGGERFVERTGLPPSRLCSLAKLRWLRTNDASAARGVRWLNVAEWIVRGLGGDETAELSLAARTGFLEFERRSWWSEAVEWAGFATSLLPEPAPAGTPAGHAAAFDNAVLAVAGHDHLCAAVGAGATLPGDLFDSCGSAEALVRAVSPPVPVEAVQRAVAGGVTVGWHVFGGHNALLGGFLSGLVLQRFLDLLGAGEDGREDLDAAAIAAPHGAGGLTVLDLTSDTASLAGIGPGVSPGLVWRAALEATAAHAAGIKAVIESVAGRTERLVVSGGWAHDPGVRAVKRQMLGSFERPPVAEAGARGAALLAGVAAGIYGGIEDLPTIKPAREVVECD